MKRLLLTILTLLSLTTYGRAQQQRQSNVTGMHVLGAAVAAEFGKWTAGVDTGFSTTGSHTVAIDTSSFTVPDGMGFMPITTSIPVRIEDFSSSETVTPSAVNCAPGSGICTFTATFSHAHPSRFHISSGTNGLQEAIQAQLGTGGEVLTTSDWLGTTSMILAATGATSVLIHDTRAGIEVWYGWNGSAYVQVFNVTNAGITATTTSLSQVDVRDYGAACNGTTNDFASVQAAINAARSSSRKLYFPSGTCLITLAMGQSLNLTASTSSGFNLGLEVTGSGIDNTVLQINHSDGAGVGIDLTGAAYVHWHDMRINGGTSGANAPTVLVLLATTDTGGGNYLFSGIDTFNDVMFASYGTYDTYILGAEQLSFTNCQWPKIGQTAIVISRKNTAGVTSPNVTVHSPAASMTNVSFDGAQTTIASTGDPTVLLDEYDLAIASIHFDNIFASIGGATSRFLKDNGQTGSTLDQITMKDVKIETAGAGTNQVALLSATHQNSFLFTGTLSASVGQTATEFELGNITNSFFNWNANDADGGAISGSYLFQLNGVSGAVFQVTTAIGSVHVLATAAATNYIVQGNDGAFVAGQTLRSSLYPNANVKAYGAIGDGTTDDSAAFNAAVAAVSAAGGGRILVPSGHYKLSSEMLVNGDTLWVDCDRATLVAGSDNQTVVHWAGQLGGMTGCVLDGGGHTGVSDLRISPASESGTSVRTVTSFNNFYNLILQSADEGLVFSTGPTIMTAQSDNSNNKFYGSLFRNNKRSVWFRMHPTDTTAAMPDRNQFFGTMIYSTSNVDNTGVQIDAGTDNDFFGLDIQGVQYGSSPNTTPTAVYIKGRSASSADNNSNKFYALRSEDNTQCLTVTSPGGYFNILDAPSGCVTAKITDNGAATYIFHSPYTDKGIWYSYSDATGIPTVGTSLGLILGVANADNPLSIAAGKTGNPSLQVVSATRPAIDEVGALSIIQSLDANQKLLFGFDRTIGTNGAGWIQAVKTGTGAAPLYLNPNGGDVVNHADIFANRSGNPVAGECFWVTDSNTSTFGATITGTGSNKGFACYDGTNWTFR